MTIKKILVAAPTARAKNYCFKAWIENVLQFTYPNYDVFLSDNTDDKGANVIWLEQRFLNSYDPVHRSLGDVNFNVVDTIALNKLPKGLGVIKKMTFGHNDCRQYALDNNYDYLLHLETDVFPPKDVIEKLIAHNMPVVGGLYYRDEGFYRKPMLQRNVRLAPNRVGSINFSHDEDILLQNGPAKYAAVGLGCVLISRDTLEKIKFRCLDVDSFHPDSYFSEDCFKYNIPIYLDPDVVCRHDNRPWGEYGKDFK